MRQTSPRRKEATIHYYAGPPPGRPIAERGVGPLAAQDGQPGIWCEECGLHIRMTKTGRMRSHALHGWGPTTIKGHPPCIGFERWVAEYGEREYEKPAAEEQPQRAPWPYLTQRAVAHRFGISVEQLQGMANNPIPAVKVRGKTGEGMYLFKRAAIESIERARRAIS